MHACIRTYIHACIHTYVHTYKRPPQSHRGEGKDPPIPTGGAGNHDHDGGGLGCRPVPYIHILKKLFILLFVMLIGRVPTCAYRLPGMCTFCGIPWCRGCKENRERWQTTYLEAGCSVLVMRCQLSSVIWGSYASSTLNATACRFWRMYLHQLNSDKLSQSFSSVEPIALCMSIKLQ